jgi:small subunit ribosomal protein S5
LEFVLSLGFCYLSLKFFMAEDNKKLESVVVDVRRVTRVTAGGRRFSLRAVVIAGDRNGRVGVGVGKGKDVAIAIAKATHQAQRNLVKVPIVDGTIPFEIEAKYNTARVFFKPSPPSRGIIAGGVVRQICSLSGLTGINAKILSRSTDKINNARVVLKAFSEINNILKKRASLNRRESAPASVKGK